MSFAKHEPDDVVRMQSVIPFLHLFGDLVVGLCDNFLNGDFVAVVLQTPKGIDLRHVLIFAWLSEMVCERPPAAFGGSTPHEGEITLQPESRLFSPSWGRIFNLPLVRGRRERSERGGRSHGISLHG